MFPLFILGAEGAAAFALAVKQLDLNATFFGTFGAAVLFGIAAANFWALGVTLSEKPQWPRQVVIAQSAVFLLASYVCLVDGLGGPRINKPVLAIAVVTALLALALMITLVVRVGFPATKSAAIVAVLSALIPLLQFWLQSDYIPTTSEPQVDLSTELSEQGRTGAIIHLTAKVTMHNRSTVRLNVAGAMMRVTGYPPSMPPSDPSLACGGAYGNEQFCAILDPMDPSGLSTDVDYRLNNPARMPDVQLVYAAGLVTAGYILTPGQTQTYQRDVDIDSSKIGLARLSAEALFLTNQRVFDTRSCGDSGASMLGDPRNFALQVRGWSSVWEDPTVPAPNAHVLGHRTCIEYTFAPRSVIEWLMDNDLVLQVVMTLDDPQDSGNEYPRLGSIYLSRKQPIQDLGLRAVRKIEQANPIGEESASSEYAIADKSPSKGAQ